MVYINPQGYFSRLFPVFLVILILRDTLVVYFYTFDYNVITFHGGLFPSLYLDFLGIVMHGRPSGGCAGWG
jgi:hypothetical protein